MSLINDALKKAQKLRTQESVPPPPAADRGPAAPIVRRGRPMAFPHVLLLLGAAVLLVILAAGVTAYVLRSDKKSAPASRFASVAVHAAPPAEAPGSLPQITLPALGEPPPPAAAKPAPPPPARALAASAPSAAPAEPPAPPQPDPRALAFIDALRITGIRASATDSKVLMNDRVFRVNDIVSYELGLRLKAVNNDSLTFVDGHGFVYTKNF